MAVVTAITLVLDVRGVDGNTASLLLRCLVDLGVVGEARGTLLGENLGDSSSQRGLAMVDVTYTSTTTLFNQGAGKDVSVYIPMVPMFK